MIFQSTKISLTSIIQFRDDIFGYYKDSLKFALRLIILSAHSDKCLKTNYPSVTQFPRRLRYC